MSDRLTDVEIECIGIGVSVGDYGNDGLVGRLLDEVTRLRERQETHLRLIADLSKTEISREHAARLDARIAALVAEVGTLRAELAGAYERCAGIAEGNIVRGCHPSGPDTVSSGECPHSVAEESGDIPFCSNIDLCEQAQRIADNIRALIK